jgi:hypothetical protein
VVRKIATTWQCRQEWGQRGSDTVGRNKNGRRLTPCALTSFAPLRPFTPCEQMGMARNERGLCGRGPSNDDVASFTYVSILLHAPSHSLNQSILSVPVVTFYRL